MSGAARPGPPERRAPLVVGVTAHRDLVASEVPGIRRRIREFLIGLRDRFPDVPLVMLCPLAEGGGRLAGQEARALGIPLIVPLPLPRALYLQDFGDAASRAEFDELTRGATVSELPLVPGETLASVSDYGPPRNLQYAQLGVFLSGHCHILLAIWDGKESPQLGGTAQVVRYHLEGEMPGFTDGALDAQQILADSENDLVHHIVCSRDREGGAPAPGLEPLETAWLCADPAAPRRGEMPERFSRVFQAMAEFNRDVRAYTDRIVGESRGLAEDETAWAEDDPVRTVDRMFRVADWLANHFQRRVSASLIVTYVLAVLMGLTFIIYTDVPDQDAMLYVFLAFFFVGFGLYLIAERRGWHRKYLDYRGLAEGLRVQFYWSAAGVTAGERTKFAHDNFLQKQDVELGWIRNVMRYASLDSDMRGATDPDRGLELAVQEWIGGGQVATGGQIRYYERQVAARSRRHRLTERIGLSCLWAGMAVTLFLALFQSRLDDGYRDPLIMLMGVLPLIAAVREAYANKKAEKELIKQYRFMHKIFDNARRRLLAARGGTEKREILRALGDAALDEHAEWILMHRERPLEHGKL